MSENIHKIEIHGCIVCSRTFNVLVVYSPDSKLMDCTLTSPDGHIVADEHQPLVACDPHTKEEIEVAHKRWLSMDFN